MLNERLLRHMVRRELMGSYTALGGTKSKGYRKCLFPGIDKDGFVICGKYVPLVPYTSPKYYNNTWQLFLREYAQVNGMKRPDILRMKDIGQIYNKWLVDNGMFKVPKKGIVPDQLIQPAELFQLPESGTNQMMGPEPKIKKKLKLKPKKIKLNPVVRSLRQISGPGPDICLKLRTTGFKTDIRTWSNTYCRTD